MKAARLLCCAVGFSAPATTAFVALSCAQPADAACSNEAIREAQHSSGLPDCRAYELASPPDKGGGEVMTNSLRTRAASDGDALAFTSLTAFGDAMGTGVTAEYMAERSVDPAPGDNGWLTHGITPKQQPLSVVVIGEGFEAAHVIMSADLSTSIVRAWSPLTGDPFVGEVPNLYERTDLAAGGPGDYTLMSPCTLCSATSTPLPALLHVPYSGFPWVAGASRDLSRVLFESTLRLAPGSNADGESGVFNVYESDGGVTRMVGLIPSSGGECTDPACVAPSGGSAAGQSTFRGSHAGSYAPHVFSSDGSRAVFTANPRSLTERGEGELYLRDLGSSPASTAQINAPERAAPGAPQPATYMDASADDSRIFFYSKAQLTETAGAGIYVYDVGAPAGHHLTLIGAAQDVAGVSEDGHYAYLIAGSQLVKGEPPVQSREGLFLWHDGAGTPPGGEIAYVGELAGGRFDSADSYADAPKRQARVSPDGRFLLFTSSSGRNLLGLHGGSDYDQTHCNEGCAELYLYDASDGQLRCVSCRPDGLPAAQGAQTQVKENLGGSSTPGTSITYENHAVSEDGRYVFFSTAESLVAQDTNGVSDAYEYDTESGEAHLLSSGQSADPSYFMDASPSGKDAFIATRERLVGWDVDRGYDVYDLRVAGGFPEPPPPPPSCGGDACQPAPVQPIDTTPGTMTFSAEPIAPTAKKAAPKHRRKPSKHKHKHKRRRGGKRVQHSRGGGK